MSDPRIAVGEDVLQVLEGVARIQRDGHGAELHRGDVDACGLEPLREQQCDDVAATHAERRQPGGDAVRALRVLLPGQHLRASR